MTREQREKVYEIIMNTPWVEATVNQLLAEGMGLEAVLYQVAEMFGIVE